MAIKQNPTKWGLNIDIAGLVALAAISAIAYLLNASFPIQVGPGLTWTFGGIFIQLADALLGPVWGGIAAAIAISPNALLLWGAPEVIAGAFIDHAIVSLLNKKLPLVIAAPLALVVTFPMWMAIRLFWNGYPMLFALQIHVKSIIQFLFNGLIATVILGIPGVGKYFPITYDSLSTKMVMGK